MQCHGDGILDVEEIALLFAVPKIRTVAAEKFDPPRITDLPASLVNHAAHVALVIFVIQNLDEVEVLSPSPGVYAAWCDLPGETVAAAAYTGSRPTLNHGKTLEAHLLDFEGDLYGQRLRLRFVEQVRKEIKFADMNELVARITTDVAQIRGILEHDR